MIDSTPPWTDIEDSVTMTESELIARMVKSIAALEARVAALEARPASGKPDNSQGETLSGGKYSGKTRDWVVQNAPDYVCFLADNGWATTRWGFRSEQITAARSKNAANPKPSR